MRGDAQRAGMPVGNPRKMALLADQPGTKVGQSYAASRSIKAHTSLDCSPATTSCEALAKGYPEYAVNTGEIPESVMRYVESLESIVGNK